MYVLNRFSNTLFMRKKVFLKVAIIVVVMITTFTVFSSCEKVKKLAEFDISYDLPDVRFTLDSVDFFTKTEHLLLSHPGNINIDSIVEEYNISGISSIKFEYIRLEIESPEQADLSWLNSSRITMSAESVEETQIADISSISPGTRMAEYELSDTNVEPVMSTGHFILNVYGDVSPPIPVENMVLVMKSKIIIRVQPV
jgi:hypothetical protein